MGREVEVTAAVVSQDAGQWQELTEQGIWEHTDPEKEAPTPLQCQLLKHSLF